MNSLLLLALLWGSANAVFASTAEPAPLAPQKTEQQLVKWTCAELGSLSSQLKKALQRASFVDGLARPGIEEVCLSQPLVAAPQIRLGYVSSPMDCNAKGECSLFLLQSSKTEGYRLVSSAQLAPLGHTPTVVATTHPKGLRTIAATTGGVVHEFSIQAAESQ